MRQNWLLLFTLLLLGCGNNSSPPRPTVSTTPPEQTTIPPAPIPTPTPAPTLHGTIQSQPFKPELVQAEGSLLVFRQGKGMLADLEIIVEFKPETALQAKQSIVVAADDKAATHIIGIHASMRKDTAKERTHFANEKFKLNLTLDGAKDGKIRGAIDLTLDGEFPVVLKGPFEATHRRAVGDEPTPAERPAVVTQFKLDANPAGNILLGYVSWPTEGIPNLQSHTLKANKELKTKIMMRVDAERAPFLEIGHNDEFEPLLLLLQAPPGRYFLFAKTSNGNIAWRWWEAKSGATDKITIEGKDSTFGSLVVKSVPKSVNAVRLAPVDASVTPPKEILELVSIGLEVSAEPKDGVAKFDKLPVGTYLIHAGTQTMEVKIEKDKTAEVELK